MSSKYVRDEVRGFIESQWTATAIVEAENVFDQQPPPNLQPWLTMLFSGGIEEHPCLGDITVTRKRELGTIQFIVFVASGTGTDTALTYAETIRTLIRGQNLNGVRLRNADPPDTAIPSQVQSSAGNYYGYSVSCDYEYDFI